MGGKWEKLRSRIRAAVVALCQEDAFYLSELRIEGTLCIVSDRTSVLVTQITEQVGQVLKQNPKEEVLPCLDLAQSSVIDLNEVVMILLAFSLILTIYISIFYMSFLLGFTFK